MCGELALHCVLLAGREDRMCCRYNVGRYGRGCGECKCSAWGYTVGCFGRLSFFIALVFYCLMVVVGDLGERLRGREAHADDAGAVVLAEEHCGNAVLQFLFADEILRHNGEWFHGWRFRGDIIAKCNIAVLDLCCWCYSPKQKK